MVCFALKSIEDTKTAHKDGSCGWSQGGLNPSIRVSTTDSSPEVAPLAPQKDDSNYNKKRKPEKSRTFRVTIEPVVDMPTITNTYIMSSALSTTI